MTNRLSIQTSTKSTLRNLHRPSKCTKLRPVLQPLQWCCIKCVIHHEREVHEEQHHTYMWCEKAIIEWSWHVNSIVACCHGAKLCAHPARDFRSQQSGAVTRMWRSCQVSLHTKNVRSVWLVVKRRGCCCNLSGCVALNVWFATDRMCVKNNTIHVARTSNNRVIMACELYCRLLPQCEALRTCCSGFPIATPGTVQNT